MRSVSTAIMVGKSYPSQERYDENNPSVSFRVPKLLLEKLKTMAAREGKTPGQYVRDFLTGKVEERENEASIYQAGYDEGRAKGEEEGYKRGVEDGRSAGREATQIWFPCSVCGKQMHVVPGSELHKEIMQYVKRAGWGHAACIDEQNQE
jgi:flagellar biosynthesis/type III secretory pathway protein FliH